ncbi:MAG: 50S ribosomal protein L9 [Patescibacteria group bacterium]|nr:50S ribosomal protein L9 [Patescibacteria group bacterium]
MKVVLKKDVEKLGFAGEIKEVTLGYGKNFLLPQKLAVLATEKEVQIAKQMQAEIKKRKEEALKQAKELSEKINSKEIKIASKANEEGILFGSITAKDISENIKEQLKLDIDEKVVALASAIKNTGEYEVKLKFAPEITADIKIIVVKK